MYYTDRLTDQEPIKNRQSDFSIEPTIYFQSNRRKTDRQKPAENRLR